MGDEKKPRLRKATKPKVRVRAKKTHCIRGHALAGQNLYVRANGYRNCRICQRAIIVRRQEREAQRRAVYARVGKEPNRDSDMLTGFDPQESKR